MLTAGFDSLQTVAISLEKLISSIKRCASLKVVGNYNLGILELGSEILLDAKVSWFYQPDAVSGNWEALFTFFPREKKKSLGRQVILSLPEVPASTGKLPNHPNQKYSDWHSSWNYLDSSDSIKIRVPLEHLVRCTQLQVTLK